MPHWSFETIFALPFSLQPLMGLLLGSDCNHTVLRNDLADPRSILSQRREPLAPPLERRPGHAKLGRGLVQGQPLDRCEPF